MNFKICCKVKLKHFTGEKRELIDAPAVSHHKNPAFELIHAFRHVWVNTSIMCTKNPHTHKPRPCGLCGVVELENWKGIIGLCSLAFLDVAWSLPPLLCTCSLLVHIHMHMHCPDSSLPLWAVGAGTSHPCFALALFLCTCACTCSGLTPHFLCGL